MLLSQPSSWDDIEHLVETLTSFLMLMYDHQTLHNSLKDSLFKIESNSFFFLPDALVAQPSAWDDIEHVVETLASCTQEHQTLHNSLQNDSFCVQI